jgi:hypothetical protein
VAAERHLAPVPPPPGHVRVQRDAYDPRPWLGQRRALMPKARRQIWLSAGGCLLAR